MQAPAIHHIEIWASSKQATEAFFRGIFDILGWQLESYETFSGFVKDGSEIYFTEMPAVQQDSLGVRHICLAATDRAQVDAVGEYLRTIGADVIRGPCEMPEYTAGYYTVDFRDPDGLVVEVAHIPS